MAMVVSESARSRLSSFGVLVWAVPQVVGIGVAAAGVPLWAHHPLPRTSVGLAEMTVAQMVTAALLFPIVFPNTRTFAVCLALLLPFDAAAQLLSSDGFAAVGAAILGVAVWCAGLRNWSVAAARSGSHRWVTAALVLSVGPILLNYAHAEVATGRMWSGFFPDPVGGVLRAAAGADRTGGLWAALPLCVGTAVTAAKRCCRRA